jgi:hypothetical protein
MKVLLLDYIFASQYCYIPETNEPCKGCMKCEIFTAVKVTRKVEAVYSVETLGPTYQAKRLITKKNTI